MALGGNLRRMHYFEARRVLKRLQEFRRLTLLSWTLTGGLEVGGRLMYEIARVAANDLPAIEPAQIPDRLRECDRSIQELIPPVRAYAAQLDVSLDRNGYNVLEDLLMEQPQAALDAIDRCIGAADEARHRALLRIVIPIYWLVIVPATAVRYPWLILEKAGLPVEYERSVVSNVLKVLLFLCYVLVVVAIGNRISPDLLRALIPK